MNLNKHTYTATPLQPTSIQADQKKKQPHCTVHPMETKGQRKKVKQQENY